MDQRLISHCQQTLKKNQLYPLKKLGKGGFGIVYLVERTKKNQKEYLSVKCTSKKQLVKTKALRKYLKQEIFLLQNLDHENIVSLVQTIEDDGWIFMVMEYCDQGNLFSIQKDKPNQLFSFDETGEILEQIINGISYMHDKNIIHRDIKPQNVLQTKLNNKTITKICDLGFSREISENAQTFCGTTYYMAPQIFMNKKYTKKVDNWAIGVLAYSMLFGTVPFKALNMENQINKKCQSGFNIYSAKKKQNPSISDQHMTKLSEMFKKAFEINPQKRLQISDFLKYFGRKKNSIPKQKIVRKIAFKKKTIETENTQSSDEDKAVSFEIQKINFIQMILTEIREINLLTTKQFQIFKYYLDKVCLQFLQAEKKLGISQQQMKTLIKLKQNVETSFENMKELVRTCDIPELKETFSDNFFSNFHEYKKQYRIVVGYAFEKAHKNIENIELKTRIKLKIFCFHVINRVFEKEYRNQIFSFFFEWMMKNYEYQEFDLRLLKKWIEVQKLKKLIQTIQIMNSKFYKKNGK